MHRTIILFVMILFLTSPAGAAEKNSESETQNVRVVNFPATQKVYGEVAIRGPLRQSLFDRREQIIIPPVDRYDTNNLIQVDPIQTDGFNTVVLSLQGEVKSEQFAPGTVGAILVPDEKPILHTFNEDRTILFPLEVQTEIEPGDNRYFTSKSASQVVGFPRYRVYLYNSSDKSVEINLYVYLTN